jgi:hypothetical protein
VSLLSVANAEALVTEEVVLLEPPTADVRVELILMSCSKLLMEMSWFTYALGSVLAVGSWFFNSVTSKTKKSLDVIEAELLLLLSASALTVVPVRSADDVL